MIEHPEIGVCGLSCRLCPMYHSEAASRCKGCKSEDRMKVGCPFITCAVKRRGIEFCWQCLDHGDCERWQRHRESGRHHDSFVCYQRLENNRAVVEQQGVSALEADTRKREQLLSVMLSQFNEGRSRTFYCIAATVMDIQELAAAITQAREGCPGEDIRERSKVLHAVLRRIAEERNYDLRLRR